MDNRQPQDGQQSRMSRSQYLQQQREADQQPVQEPRQESAQPYSREAAANQRHEESVVEKTNRLKRRLNITIIALVAAIIIVYLILFYVG